MTIVSDILQQMPAVRQPQRKFLAVLFATILALRGRVTFRNLSRYGEYSERTMARQFHVSFDWPGFHQRVMTGALDPRSELVSAQEASFIPKSGKHTFGLGHFFNGCASRAERGWEISTIAVVDVTRRCAFTLVVAQTPPSEEKATAPPAEDETRMDFYKPLEDRPHVHLYRALVWPVSLKYKLRVVVLVNRKDPHTPRFLVLASTDLALDGRKLVAYYGQPCKGWNLS